MAISAREHLDEIEAILDETYGPRKLNPGGDPVSTLVATILSQSTTDTNTERAFASLRERFPTWQQVVDADTNDRDRRHPDGRSGQQEGPAYPGRLEEINDRYGDFSLEALNDLPLDEAKAALTSIDRVGPKTAACVLLFALGRPAMPVDTHVYRVASRLPLFDPGTIRTAPSDTGGDEDADPERTYRFHVEMIAHGRTICHARNPKCESARSGGIVSTPNITRRDPTGSGLATSATQLTTPPPRSCSSATARRPPTSRACSSAGRMSCSPSFGHQQARRAAEALAPLAPEALVSSPLLARAADGEADRGTHLAASRCRR